MDVYCVLALDLLWGRVQNETPVQPSWHKYTLS